METTFIYALCEPDSDTIRYVGKSNRPSQRLSMHISGTNGHRSHLGHWVKSLKNKGLRPKLEILDEVPQSQWEFWEREYIRVFRAIGLNLVNTTDGGDAPLPRYGPDNPRFGKPVEEETKAKIRASLLGPKSPRFGKKESAETIEKKRLAATGVPCSEEKKRKISEALRGRTWSEEMRKKQLLARTGRKNTEAAKANMRAAQLLRRSKERESRGV